MKENNISFLTESRSEIYLGILLPLVEDPSLSEKPSAEGERRVFFIHIFILYMEMGICLLYKWSIIPLSPLAVNPWVNKKIFQSGIRQQ